MVTVVDQAAGLRALVNTGTARRAGEASPALARVIAVASGKGGVGKTCLVTNLAIAMAQLGRRVVVYDADIGLANVDVVMGLQPRHRIDSVLRGERTLDEVLERGPAGVLVVPGSTGQLASLSAARRDRLAEDVTTLRERAHLVLVDTGAGVSRNVTDFLALASEILVVTTPEPTALADAYALIKVSTDAIAGRTIALVVNQAESAREAQLTASRLIETARTFLGLTVSRWWGVPCDPEMVRSVKRRTPLICAYPGSPAARAVRAIANELVGGSRALE